MKIALVDDDVDFLAQTARKLAILLEERGIRASVGRFSSAEELLSEGASFDLYLLDVMLPDVNGIELGRRIRQTQPEAPIIFITTSRDFALESYSVHALDYIVKPFSHEAFAQALEHAFHFLPEKRPPVLTFRSGGGFANVPIEDIDYVEADGRCQVVHAVDGRLFVLYQSMQELWEKLKDDIRFLHVGRQFIVNLAHITAFREGEVVLSCGKTITVPRRSLAEFRQLFLRYFSA